MEPNRQPDFSLLQQHTDFYFVRHGESEANRGSVIQGRQNARLSDRGREHADAAGKWFAGKRVDAVFSSPLDRAMETATIMCKVADLPAPVPDERIIELDTGLFSGLSYGEIRYRYPAEWNSFQAQSWEAVPGAESVASLRMRAVAFWDCLIETANKGNRAIVTVSHAGILQWMIKATLSSPAWMPLFAISNCGIFQMSAQPVRAGKLDETGSVMAVTGVATAREIDPADLSSAGTRVTPQDAGETGPVVSAFAEWRLVNFVPY
ncbi:MAG TPA: histidine phosphatase family protein [Spirochaetia bacterium]|nr:histidine phosphatase family protein [Spirochaetia bacterium]